jgi:hypothetical protein
VRGAMSADYGPCGAFITIFSTFLASRNIRKCSVEDGADFSGSKLLIVEAKVDSVSVKGHDGGAIPRGLGAP